jgi:hypothetical protein
MRGDQSIAAALDALRDCQATFYFEWMPQAF